MSLLLLLLLFAAAFTASALGGVLGMASGIFIVPMLTVLFGIDIRVAVGASLISVIVCSTASSGPLLKTGLVNIRLATMLEVATAFGALCGVLLIGMVPEQALYLLFTVILGVSAWQMLGQRATDHATAYTVERVPLGLTLMYFAGVISALLGIGSGVLKIPAMDTAMRLPIKVSSATSNFMIGVTGAASAGAYFMRGDINTLVAAPVALGSVLGAIAGTRVLIGLHPGRLRLLFVVVLVLLGVHMGVSAFGFGGAQ